MEGGVVTKKDDQRMEIIDRHGNVYVLEVMDIDAETAVEMLKCNTRNRLNNRGTPSVIKSYAEDMKNDRWKFVGDPIRFDTAGLLVDGQHRLYALVESGGSETFVVIRDLPPIEELAGAVDGGHKRRTSDELSIRGVHNTPGVAATARLLWQWRQASVGIGKTKNQKLPNSVLVPFCVANGQLLDDAFGAARRIHAAVGMGPPSAFAAAAAIAMCVDPGRWSEFEQAAISGAGLDVDDPVLALRTWWIRRGPASNTHESQLRSFTVMRAFIAYRSGQKMQRMNVVERPILPDDFDWSMLQWNA
jgi:hypothetical protein